MVFYVPKGTEMFGAFATGRAAIYNASGEMMFELTGEPGYIAVPVSPGDSGQCWRFVAKIGRLQLMTVPLFMAPSVQQLLIPREMVEQDSSAPTGR